MVLPELPVELSKLCCALDATGCGLLDVDVGVSFFVEVLLDVQIDSCEADGFALPPADALEGEDRISVVGEGLVLWQSELVRDDASQTGAEAERLEVEE